MSTTQSCFKGEVSEWAILRYQRDRIEDTKNGISDMTEEYQRRFYERIFLGVMREKVSVLSEIMTCIGNSVCNFRPLLLWAAS